MNDYIPPTTTPQPSAEALRFLDSPLELVRLANDAQLELERRQARADSLKRRLPLGLGKLIAAGLYDLSYAIRRADTLDFAATALADIRLIPETVPTRDPSSGEMVQIND